MARQKKKPEFEAKNISQEMIDNVATVYLVKNVSLREISKEFGITMMKARKLLTTAGVYQSDIASKVLELRESGKSIEEIQEILGLSRTSVHSYLPYTKVVYNCVEISTGAERVKRWREKNKYQELLKV